MSSEERAEPTVPATPRAQLQRSQKGTPPSYDIRHLAPEQKIGAIAAFVLLLTLFLPWYEKSFFVITAGQKPVAATENLNAFQVFTFVEAGVLVMALAILYLIWARARQRTFALPGGDGFALLLGGAWIMVLLVWRLFDKPHVRDAAATVGIQWGIFAAILATAAVISAGVRLRARRPSVAPLRQE